MNGLVCTPLIKDQCQGRLVGATAGTGRLAFHAKALPLVPPVDFALDERA